MIRTSLVAATVLLSATLIGCSPTESDAVEDEVAEETAPGEAEAVEQPEAVEDDGDNARAADDLDDGTDRGNRIDTVAD